ncbi:MAG: CARDB domain-containing protein [Candidatus Helarchaeota archaeon]
MNQTSLKGTPKFVWNQSITAGDIHFYKIIDDAPNSSSKILIASTPYLYCFNATQGDFLWSINLAPYNKVQDLAFGNISGTSSNQIVIGFKNSKIISAIDTQNKLYLWNASLNFTGSDCFIQKIRIGNVYGTDLDELIIGTTGKSFSEEIQVLDNNGQEIWARHYGSVESYSVLDLDLSDLNHDGYLDIIAACTKGLVQARNGTDGALLWGFQINDDLNNDSFPDDFTNMILGDFTGEGTQDILVSSNYKIYAINGSNGKSLWNITFPSSNYGIFLGLNHINKSVSSEIICAGSIFTVIFPNGTIKLNRTMAYPATCMELNDFNNDGLIDVGLVFKTAEIPYIIIWNSTSSQIIFQLSNLSKEANLGAIHADTDPYNEILIISLQTSYFQCYELAPDLCINLNEIEYYPNSPIQGDLINFNLTIENIGGLKITTPFNLTLYLDEENPSQILDYKLISKLNFNTPLRTVLKWDTSTSPLNHTLIFIVDSLFTINEGNEENNRAIITIYVQSVENKFNLIILFLGFGIFSIGSLIIIFLFLFKHKKSKLYEKQKIFESFTEEKSPTIMKKLNELIITPLITINQIEDELVREFLLQDFTLLSPKLIERVLKLHMKLPEKIQLIHELIQMSPSDQEKILTSIEGKHNEQID